MITNI